MNRWNGILLMTAAFAVLDSACDKSNDKGGKSAGTLPAEVSGRVQEADLTTVRLTTQAEQRLGIQTVPVEIKDVPHTRTYPGEVMIPPGRAIVVSAPVAGVVTLPSQRKTEPSPGMHVTPAESLLLLVPGAMDNGNALAASDRISLTKARADVLAARVEAEGQVREAQVRIDAAKVNLDRAEALKRENAGSQRAFDEARAVYQLADAAQASARDRLAALAGVLSELDAGRQAAIPMVAPVSGVIRSIYVAPGQAVPSGAALFEVVALNPLWVRVPVYVGDIDQLVADGTASLHGLSGHSRTDFLTARRVFPPGSADPVAATVDLYYEVADAEQRLRPGERVGAVIKTWDQDTGLVVPYSAILYDINGGTWVYEKTVPNTYVRRRVAIRVVVNGKALLARGPSPGANIVTAGAAELFGTEFGAGK